MQSRISRIQLHPVILLLGVAEAGIFALSVYLSGIIVNGSVASTEAIAGSLAGRALIISSVMIVSLIAVGLYQMYQRFTFGDVVARLVVGIIFGTIALSAIYGIFPVVVVPPMLGVVTISVAVPLIVVFRYFVIRKVDENIFRRKILIYGCGKRAATIGDLRRKADRRGFQIVACVPAPGDQSVSDSSWHIVSNKPLRELTDEFRVDEIVIAMDDRRGNFPMRELLDCRLKGVEIIDLIEFMERETGKIRVDLVNPGWLIFSPGFRVTRLREITKKVIDFTLSIFLLILSTPILLLVSIAIKCEDGVTAPVFYKQKRVGLHGDKFSLLKFRSMGVDAESAGKAVWANVDDERVNRVGRIIRKCRLDELPQLINVLRGEMSWVGPRPERPEFVDELSKTISYYAERHAVRPGITGWAQLRYAYGSSEKDSMEKLQYDLYYIKNQSVMLDLVILLQTIEVVLWGKGAR